MKVSHELAHYLIDQLSPTGRFSARAMFGCTALFLNGLMVLLITRQGEIYVKTDAASQHRFAEAGCQPFTYTRRGPSGIREVALSFSQLPEGVVEEQDALISWVKPGIEAARRAAAGDRL